MATTDVQSRSNIEKLLLQSLQPNREARLHAEEQLEQNAAKPGFLGVLLELVARPDIPVDQTARHAAVIRLKNLITDRYFKPREVQVPEADRQVLRTNLFESILYQPVPAIRSQLLVCFFRVIQRDFPDQWPDIMPKILAHLRCATPSKVYGALCCLRMIFKKYQQRSNFLEVDGKPVSPLNAIIRDTFPILLDALKMLVKNRQHEAHEMIRIIAKIVYSSITVDLPPPFIEPAALNEWIPHLVMVLVKPVTKDMLPDAPAAAAAMAGHGGDGSLAAAADVSPAAQARNLPLVKAQKWVARIMVRLFQRYGRPSHVDPGWRAFAELWQAKFASGVMLQMLQVLHNLWTGHFVSDPVLVCAYSYLHSALFHSATYTEMKKYSKFIIFECAFRTMMLKDDDVEIYQTDAEEFVRRQLDYEAVYYDPVVGARRLVSDLVRVRSRDSLQRVWAAIQQTFASYAAAPPQEKNPREKEAAMHVFGSLSRFLLRYDLPEDTEPEQRQNAQRLAASVEALLVAHALPEFDSPVGFLRARTCWLFGCFGHIRFSDPEHHKLVADRVVRSLLKDGDWPVQMQAAQALSKVVLNERSLRWVRPHMPLVLDALFRLLDAHPYDFVLETFDVVIDCCGMEISPWALQVVHRFVAHFRELVKQEEQDEDSVSNAVQAVRCINTILYSCHELPPSLYSKFEPQLQELVVHVLRTKNFEYVRYVFDMLAALTSYQQELSDFAWLVFPLVFEACTRWAPDQLKYALLYFDNMIERGGERFIEPLRVPRAIGPNGQPLPEPEQQPPPPSAMHLIVMLGHHMLGVPNPEIQQEVDGRFYSVAEFPKWGVQLLETAVFARRRARDIDSFVPQLLKIAHDNMLLARQHNRPRHLMLALNVVAAAAMYNPPHFFRVLQQEKWTDFILAQWKAHLPPDLLGRSGMEWPQKRASLVGLASLLSVPFAEWPEAIRGQPAVRSFMTQVIDVLIDMNYEETDDLDENGQPIPGAGHPFGVPAGGAGAGGAEDPAQAAGVHPVTSFFYEEPSDPADRMLAVPESYDYVHPGEQTMAVRRANADRFGAVLPEDDEDDEEFAAPRSKLEDVNEVLLVFEFLGQVKQREPEFYEAWQASIPPRKNVLLNKYFQAETESQRIFNGRREQEHDQKLKDQQFWAHAVEERSRATNASVQQARQQQQQQQQQQQG